MIYLKENFDLQPASPAQRDRFVDSMESAGIEASAAEGGRLMASWFAHEDWFTQILNVTEFESWEAFGNWREASRSDSPLASSRAKLASLCAQRHEELLEPLGPVGPERLQQAIDACQAEPAGHYTFAILEVSEGLMGKFKSMLAAVAPSLPILAAWGDVAGNPNRVIDLWRGDTGKAGFRPTDDQQDAFFEPLRKLAPKEKMMRLHPMPYSPLR